MEGTYFYENIIILIIKLQARESQESRKYPLPVVSRASLSNWIKLQVVAVGTSTQGRR